MPWKNHNGDISDLRPSRVRLANAETRTAEEVTDEILAEAGWYWAEPPVVIPDPVVEPEVIIGLPEEITVTNSNTTDNSVFVFDGIAGNISI